MCQRQHTVHNYRWKSQVNLQELFCGKTQPVVARAILQLHTAIINLDDADISRSQESAQKTSMIETNFVHCNHMMRVHDFNP